MRTTTKLQPVTRAYLPEELRVTTWSELEYYYHELLNRPICSLEDLECWILNKSELDALVNEELSWRIIHHTVDIEDKDAEKAYQYAVQELSPQITSYEYRLNQKLTSTTFISGLDPQKYHIYLRSVKNALSLFCEENVPLTTEVHLRLKEYSKVFSVMTVGVNGVQMTLQKAGALLEEPNRVYREAVYHKIYQRILQDTDFFENLFEDLLRKRHQIALNAGFENYRDYKFCELGRFDYSAEDCLAFHDSIASEILPLVENISEYRRDTLELDALRPWDLNVDTCGNAPLRPFENVDELVEKSIRCLSNVHPFFGEVIANMRDMGRLDLDSRRGKRPGGYNMPLHRSGVPFVFMNATNTLNDMRMLMHESGHAVHSFLSHAHPLSIAKRIPMEVAELASMTMELLSMDHWDIFFENPDDLKRAKVAQLEYVLKALPWIAAIDKFQHWLYTNPEHTRQERKATWMQMLDEFSPSAVDRSGLEHYQEYLWHRQLHVFEVPFYYIEYGMAQLGAIAIWKQYRENPEQTIQNYRKALELGYTQPIREIYRAAGIAFDFSRDYVRELGGFVKEELNRLLGQS